MTARLLPDKDEELLRNLYTRGRNNKRAVDSAKFKITY